MTQYPRTAWLIKWNNEGEQELHISIYLETV
jgi:hypothetical protein